MFSEVGVEGASTLEERASTRAITAGKGDHAA
jgi:hypothetical protein